MTDTSNTSDTIYNEEFFSRYYRKPQYLKDHKTLAEAILKIFQPAYVIDIGCGSGQILNWITRKTGMFRFRKRVRVRGYEGSPYAQPFWDRRVRDYIEVADCTQPLPPQEKADLVICLEVAEHVPTNASDGLVQNIASLASRYILFSAAPPGQGGEGHINEQPWSFWAERYERFSFKVDQAKTDVFLDYVKDRIVSPWYKENIKVLRCV